VTLIFKVELFSKYLQGKELGLCYWTFQSKLKIVENKVNWVVTKHLNAQGKLDPRGGLRCFWRLDKT
jgi:hypothetical protein